MEITQKDNVITVTSILQSGYSYLHTVQKITSNTVTLVASNITDSVSEFSLTLDGYHSITEIKLPNSSPGT